MVQALDQFTQTHLFGVIGMALVRDSLKDRGVDSLLEACSRPQWMVSHEDIHVWFPSTRRVRSLPKASHRSNRMQLAADT